MTKNQKRDIATSLTTFTFLIIGITGIMMFFHIFDKYTKDLHEILGIVFVVAVMFHIIFNFKSMKQYFNKKIFLVSGIASIVVSLAFVLNTPQGESSKEILFKGVFDSNIEQSLILFTKDYDLAIAKLTEAGIKTEGFKTIKEVAKGNKTSPFKILQIVSSK